MEGLIGRTLLINSLAGSIVLKKKGSAGFQFRSPKFLPDLIKKDSEFLGVDRLSKTSFCNVIDSFC